MSESAPQPTLNEALDRLWRQFLPQIDERVAVLERAGAALAGNTLSQEKREAAQAAAHKLAGVLGTFGLTKGTVLAREAEVLYSADIDPETIPTLVQLAEQLRALVASRS